MKLFANKKDVKRQKTTGSQSPNIIAGGDVNIQFGLTATKPGFKHRVRRFLKSYLGTSEVPVAFGGRTHEVEALNKWLLDPKSPTNLLVAAKAGRGKTALLVRWCSQLTQLGVDFPIAFIPISIRYETNRPSIFYQALAARLAEILKEDLQAPATDPADFYKEKVIEYLDQFEGTKKRCLVVIDGLDEAVGWSVDASIFPPFPVSGLRFVVSARFLTGDKNESGWLRRLDWDTASNPAKYVPVRPLAEEGIADILVSTGGSLISLANNTDVLKELKRLTSGDPLLLTYYVEDLRKHAEDPDSLQLEQLQGLEAGFGPYFKIWINEQHGVYQEIGSAFDEQTIKMILGVLACAIGPIKLRDLAHLVKEIHGCTRIIAQDTIEPLSRFVVGDGTDIGYSLGHPKLSDYLKEEYFGGSDVISKTKAGFLAWGHETILVLEEKRLDPVETPSYLLHFYVQHLNAEGADPHLFRELASNGWRRAWEADEEGESYRGFNYDIKEAFKALWAVAELGEGANFVWALAGCIRCALILSSINSLSSNIPWQILAAALIHKKLAIGQFIHFMEYRLPIDVVKAAIEVIPSLSKTQCEAVLEETLVAARAADNEESRAEALAAIASQFPEVQRQSVLEEALSAARAMNDHDWKRANILTAVASQLPVARRHAILEDALTAAMNIYFEKPHAKALSAIALQLPEAQRQALLEEALSAARAIGSEMDRAEVLVAIAPNLPVAQCQDILEEALTAARAIDIEKDRAEVLVAIAPKLPEARHQAVLEEALSAARAIGYEEFRAEALTVVASQLPEARHQAVLEEALSAARAIGYEGNRAKSLTVVASQLPVARRQAILEEALTAARSINEGDSLAEVLTAIAPQFPVAQCQTILEEALIAAKAIGNGGWRADTLAAIAPQLMADDQVEEALIAAKAIRDEGGRAEVLAAIASKLPETRRQAILEKALSAAKAIGNAWLRAEALAAITPQIPEARRQVILEEVLTAAVGIIDDEWKRDSALASIAIQLSVDQIKEALTVTEVIGSEGIRAETLATIAPKLPKAQCQSVLEEVLTAAKTFIEDEEETRVQVLSVVAQQFPKGQRQTILGEALATAKVMANEQSRADALVTIAPQLMGDQIEEALAAAKTINDDGFRAKALGAIAQQFPKMRRQTILEEALSAANDLDIDGFRVAVLAEIVSQLPEAQRQSVLEQILTVAKNIGDEEERAGALSIISSQLTGGQIETVIIIVGSLARLKRRSVFEVLIGIQPSLELVGGQQLLDDIAQAIIDVGEWWP